MHVVRVFFVGGMLSFRALFSWLTPWIYIPSLLVAPVVQILFFAYLGRSTGVGSDEFYLVGNAILFVAVPCLFGMSKTITDERMTQTLALLMVSPVWRPAVFLGRALPVLINGWLISVVSLTVGARVLDVAFSLGTWVVLAGVAIVAALSCTGLGLLAAAVGFRVRAAAALTNVLFGVLLIFSGAAVPLAALPAAMQVIGAWLPLRHAIEAGRLSASGSELDPVLDLLGRELAIGAAYLVAGLVLLRFFEWHGRRHASFEQV